MTGKAVPIIVAGLLVINTAVIALLGGNHLPEVAHAAVGITPEDDDKKKEIPDDPTPEDRIQFYNWLNDDSHKYNFGPSGYEAAANYLKVSGELYDRLRDDGDADEKLPDPCLAAAIAYAVDKKRGTEILAEEYDKCSTAGEVINEAAGHMVDDGDYFVKVQDAIIEELDEATVTIEDIGKYTSMMWMVPTTDRYEDRPTVTVADSTHDGGHALVFKWSDGTVLRLRMECGYQPMDIVLTPPSKTTTPPPTTNPPGTTPPKETTPPPTTTTLQPKDTKQGVDQSKSPENGGKKGGDANKTVTPEPTWPKATTPTTNKPATQTQTRAVQDNEAPEEEVVHNGRSYVVDRGAEPSQPQSATAGDTPNNAAVKNDPVNTGTAPGLGAIGDLYN